jgi:DNA-binding NarL/FixJ family response regulator
VLRSAAILLNSGFANWNLHEKLKVMKKTVLVVDDHPMVAEGIRSVIGDMDGFEVAGVENTGEGAIEFCEKTHPDIVIMDVSLPGMDGIEATRRIKGMCPETRIIVFTVHDERDYVLNLFRAGVSAYVRKEDPVSDLKMAIQAVSGGGTYFSSKAPSILLEHLSDLEESRGKKNDYESMSPRELEVFKHLAEGFSIKEIADKLAISPKTVESHKYNIMAKLKLRSMSDLVKLAIRKKLISL